MAGTGGWADGLGNQSAYKLEVFHGQTFEGKTALDAFDSNRVTGGERWWFHASNNDSQRPLVSLRVLFAPGTQPPGDEMTAPVELGSQLPVRGRTDLRGSEATAAELALLENRFGPVAWFRWTAPVGANVVRARSTSGFQIFADTPAGTAVLKHGGRDFDNLRVTPERTYFMRFTVEAVTSN
ncbi:MAG: hypothetical protein R3F19_25590 [Verrucomicrobiales bacterium]